MDVLVIVSHLPSSLRSLALKIRVRLYALIIESSLGKLKCNASPPVNVIVLTINRFTNIILGTSTYEEGRYVYRFRYSTSVCIYIHTRTMQTQQTFYH